MKLDINSAKGRATVLDARRAVDAILRATPGREFIHTKDGDGKDEDGHSDARVDGFFTCMGEITSVVEIKCRYDMDLNKFMTERKGEWLLTQQKVRDLRTVCELLHVPGFGILYIVPSKIVLMRMLINNEGFALCDWRQDMTKTQRTVNGGDAMRMNVFIPMQKAKRFKV